MSKCQRHIDIFLHLLYIIKYKMHKTNIKHKEVDIMIKGINKETSYEELCRIEEEFENDPSTSEEDLLEIAILRGEKEIELGYGYTIEEVYKELLGKELVTSNIGTKSEKKPSTN